MDSGTAGIGGGWMETVAPPPGLVHITASTSAPSTLQTTLNGTAIENDHTCLEDMSNFQTCCFYDQMEYLDIKIWLAAFVGSIMSLASIFENLLLLYMFATRVQFRTSNMFYMMFLAFCDVFVCASYICIMGVQVFAEYFQVLTLYIMWHQYLRPMFAVSHIAMSASAFLIMMATFEREAAEQTKKSVRAATRMLILVVTCYLIANTLSVIITTWEFYDDKSLLAQKKFYTLSVDFVNVLTVWAAAVRLPIYWSCNQQIRVELKAIFQTDLPKGLGLSQAASGSKRLTLTVVRRHSHLVQQNSGPNVTGTTDQVHHGAASRLASRRASPIYSAYSSQQTPHHPHDQQYQQRFSPHNYNSATGNNSAASSNFGSPAKLLMDAAAVPLLTGNRGVDGGHVQGRDVRVVAVEATAGSSHTRWKRGGAARGSCPSAVVASTRVSHSQHAYIRPTSGTDLRRDPPSGDPLLGNRARPMSMVVDATVTIRRSLPPDLRLDLSTTHRQRGCANQVLPAERLANGSVQRQQQQQRGGRPAAAAPHFRLHNHSPDSLDGWGGGDPLARRPPAGELMLFDCAHSGHPCGGAPAQRGCGNGRVECPRRYGGPPARGFSPFRCAGGNDYDDGPPVHVPIETLSYFHNEKCYISTWESTI